MSAERVGQGELQSYEGWDRGWWGPPGGGGGCGDRGERGGVGWDLKGAEHGKEGLSNNSAEEQVAERGNSQSTGACLQGVDLCWVHPP